MIISDFVCRRLKGIISITAVLNNSYVPVFTNESQRKEHVQNQLISRYGCMYFIVIAIIDCIKQLNHHQSPRGAKRSHYTAVLYHKTDRKSTGKQQKNNQNILNNTFTNKSQEDVFPPAIFLLLHILMRCRQHQLNSVQLVYLRSTWVVVNGHNICLRMATP